MKNTLIIAGLVIGLAVTPFGFAKPKPTALNEAVVSIHCGGTLKPLFINVSVTVPGQMQPIVKKLTCKSMNKVIKF
jgi:hypothetical protein